MTSGGERVSFCYGFGTRLVEHAPGDGLTLTTVCATTQDWVSYYKSIKNLCVRDVNILCVFMCLCVG